MKQNSDLSPGNSRADSLKTILAFLRSLFSDDSRVFAILLFLTLGIGSRLLPHPANATAMSALGLVALLHFKSLKWSVSLTLFSWLVSEVVLGFHSLSYLVAICLICNLALMRLFVPSSLKASKDLEDSRRNSDSKNTLGIMDSVFLGSGSVLSSLIFFLVTNFGVWVEGLLYPRTLEGLLLCYTKALPFLPQQILGELIYLGIFVLVLRVCAKAHLLKSPRQPQVTFWQD